jgi:hypothetical protein
MLGNNMGSFLASNTISEVGAHQAEADFLRDKLKEMQKAGECGGFVGTGVWQPGKPVTGNLPKSEKEKRWEQADKEVRFHLEIK